MFKIGVQLQFLLNNCRGKYHKKKTTVKINNNFVNFPGILKIRILFTENILSTKIGTCYGQSCVSNISNWFAKIHYKIQATCITLLSKSKPTIYYVQVFIITLLNPLPFISPYKKQKTFHQAYYEFEIFGC